MELNRGRVGIPLHKLANVFQETHQFLGMLGEDVHLPAGGDWLALDFENQSLNFTAEYVGPVEESHVQELESQVRAAVGGMSRLAQVVQNVRQDCT